MKSFVGIVQFFPDVVNFYMWTGNIQYAMHAYPIYCVTVERSLIYGIYEAQQRRSPSLLGLGTFMISPEDTEKSVYDA